MKDRIEHLFKTFETMSDDDFTERELDFVISLESQYKKNRYLSDLQLNILEEIIRRGKER